MSSVRGRFVWDKPSTLNDDGFAAASAKSESDTPGAVVVLVVVVLSDMFSSLSSPLAKRSKTRGRLFGQQMSGKCQSKRPGGAGFQVAATTVPQFLQILFRTFPFASLR